MTNTHFFVLYKFIKTNYNKSIDREHHQEYEKYKKYKRKPSGTTKKTENLSLCRQGGNNHEHTISLRLCRKFFTPTEIKRRKKEFRRRDNLTGKTGAYMIFACSIV